jgi:hypothetical protein
LTLRGKAEETATRILSAFQSGSFPKALALIALAAIALAPIFVRRKDSAPCRKRSWSNQLLTALAGYSDARGYRQWQEVGRHVKKGERAFHILAPIVRTIREEKDGEEVERKIVCGFTSVPVFGLDQTEGEPLPDENPELTAWLEKLPLREVAESWGLSVDAFNGEYVSSESAAGRVWRELLTSSAHFRWR